MLVVMEFEQCNVEATLFMDVVVGDDTRMCMIADVMI